MCMVFIFFYVVGYMNVYVYAQILWHKRSSSRKNIVLRIELNCTLAALDSNREKRQHGPLPLVGSLINRCQCHLRQCLSEYNKQANAFG